MRVFKIPFPVVLFAALFFVKSEASANGLLARFQQGERKDALVLPNAALYLPAGTAPTRLLEDGDFELRIEGGVSVELRALYAFQIEASGQAEVSINGRSVLTLASAGLSELSKPVRLNRGTNALSIKLAPSQGRATQFRLFWKSRSMAEAIPIPGEVLSHDAEDAALRESDSVRAGATALAKYRCTHCHQTELRGFPELEMDAPDLTLIGSRLHKGWMTEWIADPAKSRADAHMPKLVSKSDAAAIAEYLASSEGSRSVEPSQGSAKTGANLFGTLQCGGCHTAESLSHVGRKFRPGALQGFLLNPQAHYRWNRMPNYKLSAEEASDLAAFLGESERGESSAANSSVEVERGRELVQTAGCLACHGGSEANRYRTKPLDDILARAEGGCLDAENDRAPRFSFGTGEREALVAFLKRARLDVLTRDSSIEFALRQTAALGCAQCHDSADGVIQVQRIGGKLRPEWVGRFLSGKVPYKPRPWLTARMPIFEAHAELLAAGLAALHGVPPETQQEPAIDEESAAVGARLVSAAGGFSCVACHAVGSSSGALVVESPGVNLAHSGERLLKEFFHRWVLNPIALEPATKMPVYFDETGRSQLLEFFDGDAARQIDAIWEYVRLGEKMPPPPAP